MVHDSRGRAVAESQYIIGLHAIANRLECSVPTVRKMHAEEGLLLFRQRLNKVRPGARGWAWCTTPELISLWMVARCQVDRQYIPPRLLKGKTSNRLAADGPR